MKEFFTRTLSGIIFITVVIAGIWFNEYSLLLLLLAILIPSLIEFYQLSNKLNFDPCKVFGVIAGILIILVSHFTASSMIEYQYLTLTFLIILLIPVFILFYQPSRFVQSFVSTLTGVIYIAVPLALINYISFRNAEYERTIMLAFFAILWTFDSFAYITGTLIGKTKLFKEISPGKTIEGIFGGTIFALIIAYIISLYSPSLTSIQWIIFAIIISIAGTTGDLIESAIKRNSGVKDSGSFLPGHGGFLDRFDSLFFSVPFVFVYLYIFT